jgi:DNA-binding CsgD family transcriptional regulator/tetratricopeptide (TPR) repeat protein
VLLEREQPAARLEAALAAARRGQGRIVALEGEAGIGKTALALSFVARHRADAQVFVGGCEQLTTPEPLGPLRDIERESAGRFTLSGRSQLETFGAVLRLLTSGREPGLLLIEDIHWADDPTLDLLRYLGRRLRAARMLVVATFRNDEATSRDRLAALWGDLPLDSRERIELHALSPAAVSALAARNNHSDTDLYAVTGGNPFHVTEFLATDRVSVPRSVRDATLARTVRLSSRARRSLDCASIFPRTIDQSLLRELSDDAEFAGVEECMRAGMLNANGEALAFRHELARRAVHEAMAPLRRRELHQAALELLKARGQVRPAELAHHAQQAGAVQDLVRYSREAAAEANALGARRESVAHLGRILEFGTWLSNAERADVLQRQAEAGEQCGALELATAAIAEAIAARKRAGDIPGLGDALRISARIRWLCGQSDVAESQSLEALQVLQDHHDTWQYAMAMSAQSQLDMLAERTEAAIEKGTHAMQLAERLSRWDIYLHAWTNVATSRASLDLPAGIAEFLAAIAETRQRGELDLLPRLYSNLIYMMAHDRRYEGLFSYLEEGLAVAGARDNAPLEAYMRGVRALALIDLGRLAEAQGEAEEVVHGPYPRGTGRFPAQIALARARIRTGQPEDGVLDEARALPTARRDIMRLGPIAVLDAEAHWLGVPRPQAIAQLHTVFARCRLVQGQTWNLSETALWLAILGEPVPLEEIGSRLRAPHRAHIAGDWRIAAQLWEELGCPYEQALALSQGDEASRREALRLLDALGAEPAAARVRRELRAMGARAVPRGPIAATRASPAGLTRRQAQVFVLLVKGLNNGQIARRLSISRKTTEHHVSAIIARLGVGSRGEAAAVARARGLLGAEEI